MYEKRMGKGEDTILALRIKSNQRIFYVTGAKFFHPKNESTAFPTDPCHNGLAIAYSRRLIFDNYLLNNAEVCKRNLKLLRLYLGQNISNFFSLIPFSKRKYLYYVGFLVGSLRAFSKTYCQNLTPDIDWWKDAEEALQHAIILQ